MWLFNTSLVLTNPPSSLLSSAPASVCILCLQYCFLPVWYSLCSSVPALLMPFPLPLPQGPFPLPGVYTHIEDTHGRIGNCGPHIGENICLLSLWTWIASHSVIFFHFTIIFSTNVIILFLFTAEWISIVCMYHTFIVCSSVDCHLTDSISYLLWIGQWTTISLQ